ncbi:MAG: hypothetical protein CM15mV56_190 [uncultured marine virus]|nr:MAG: hypothetical protein CM15mV56_190 [uncultured marine virus]
MSSAYEIIKNSGDPELANDFVEKALNVKEKVRAVQYHL